MSDAIGLVRAVLADACTDDDMALQYLEDALALEVDPLVYFAHRFSLGKPLVFERAAAWAGLAYSTVVAIPEKAQAHYDRLDSFGEVRLIRQRLFDRDIAYSAPLFADMVRLRSRVEANPVLRRRLCIVPDPAIRAGLAASAEEVLVEEARHRLARRWPFASAHLDLPLVVRVGFVALLGLAMLLASAAPLLPQPLLLPPLIVFLALPALLRLAAAVRPLTSTEPPALADSDLPDYSVLIPLCDEANMVPLLAQAMKALDYPALCSKSTKIEGAVTVHDRLQSRCRPPVGRRDTTVCGNAYGRRH